MASNRIKPPAYRHHKASGQAVVTLSGKDIYLGPHGTRLSKQNYDRVVSEWLAAGRTLPQAERDAPITVVEVLNAFRKSDALPASHAPEYMTVMRMVKEVYGRTPAQEFGPIALKVVRTKMVEAGWKRRTINQRVHYVRRIFKWAVEHQMIDAEQLVALRALEPLKEGRTTAPESAEVQPVDITHVEACIKHMPPTVEAMVRLGDPSDRGHHSRLMPSDSASRQTHR